ncbi:hypothetical protein E3U43_007151 [Larimichthys crocea]|uniref:Uncharacterized protein n=1 Tax=Larimichthys crocea TaxID=215358 RepID=A0ACD3RN78_LARCR|nr:hypothetical protein E3U43_007151 [Larimichthys crocea]
MFTGGQGDIKLHFFVMEFGHSDDRRHISRFSPPLYKCLQMACVMDQKDFQYFYCNMHIYDTNTTYEELAVNKIPVDLKEIIYTHGLYATHFCREQFACC